MSKDIIEATLREATHAFNRHIDEIPLGEEYRLRSLCKTLYLQILVKDAKATVDFCPMLGRNGVVPVINWSPNNDG
jgi:hypothetical protein